MIELMISIWIFQVITVALGLYVVFLVDEPHSRDVVEYIGFFLVCCIPFFGFMALALIYYVLVFNGDIKFFQ